MNIPHAIEMIEFGLNWENRPGKTFLFTTTAKESDCGTVGCFAGWFAMTHAEKVKVNHNGYYLCDGLTAISWCMQYIEVDRHTAEGLWIMTHSAPWVKPHSLLSARTMQELAAHMINWLEWETGEKYEVLKEKHRKPEVVTWAECIWQPTGYEVII